jgi:hypothetical protein
LWAGRVPGQSLVAGRGNAIAEEVSQGLNFGERHAAVGGGIEGKPVRLQLHAPSTTSTTSCAR